MDRNEISQINRLMDRIKFELRVNEDTLTEDEYDRLKDAHFELWCTLWNTPNLNRESIQ